MIKILSFLFLFGFVVSPVSAQLSDDYGTTNNTGYCPKISLTMQRGARDSSHGGQVSELQRFLSEHYDIDPEEIVTGFFGRITQGYVQKFQRQQGLPAFGIVGSMTRSSILKECKGVTFGTNTPINIPTNNYTNTTQTPFVNLKLEADGGVSNEKFVRIIITGNERNKEVSYWKLKVSCPTGVTSTDEKERGNTIGQNNCRDFIFYPQYNPTQDYLLFAQGFRNTSSSNVNVVFSLQAYGSNGVLLGGDKEGLDLSEANQTTASVLSPFRDEQVTSPTLTISGTASGLSQINMVISFAKGGDKAYGSQNIPVINGIWSAPVSPALAPNVYTINVYDVNNNLLTTSYFKVVSSNTQPLVVTTSNNIFSQGIDQVVQWSKFEGDFVGYTVNLANRLIPVQKHSLFPKGQSGALISKEATSVLINGLSFSDNLINTWLINSGGSINEEDLRKNFYIIVQAEKSLYEKSSIAASGSSQTISIQKQKVIQPSITVISPNGGEIWQAGSTQNVKWISNSLSTSETVTFRLMNTQGSVVAHLAENVLNTGEKSIIVPANIASGQYKLEVNRSKLGAPSITDSSNNYFTIIEPQRLITLLSPNGGETYQTGDQAPVRFITNLTDKQTPGISFQLYRGGIASSDLVYVQDIVLDWPGGSPYIWKIPSLPSGKYSMYANAKINDVYFKEGGVYDFSDSLFTINSNN